jgi:hypothetical protein
MAFSIALAMTEIAALVSFALRVQDMMGPIAAIRAARARSRTWTFVAMRGFFWTPFFEPLGLPMMNLFFWGLNTVSPFDGAHVDGFDVGVLFEPRFDGLERASGGVGEDDGAIRHHDEELPRAADACGFNDGFALAMDGGFHVGFCARAGTVKTI